jgi:tetratricopeptide (TPR) repeat protein
VAQIAARIEREEQARARNSADDSADFAQLIWLGRWRLNRLTREDSAAASKLFDAASEMAPESAEVLIQKTTTLCWEKWARRAPRSEFSTIRDLARRAILINPDDCRGYWLAGVAETWLRNPAAAIGQLTRAIEINPCFEPAHAQLGSTLNLCDRPEDALKSLERALMLSPYDTHVFFRYTELGVSRSMLGEYEAAVDWTDRALLQRPAYWYAHVIKIHALISNGDEIAAKAAGRELTAMLPRFSRAAIEWIPFLDQRWVSRLCGSLSRAGVLLA